MSFYTANIRSEQIDPRLDQSNKRAEFRFNPASVYLSNMRLLNVGITATQADYDVGSGALSVIKNITLLSDGLVIDQLRDVDRYGAFINYNKSNAGNKSVNRFLKLNNLGYEVSKLNDSNVPEETKIVTPFTANQFNTTLDTTKRSWLDLKELLPFLSQVLYLPTDILKNMVLRIEFNSAVGTAQNTTAPLLVADSMGDDATAEKMAREFKGATYISVEQDQVVIDGLSPTAANPAPAQSVKKMLKGFDNKYLNRVVFCKIPNSDSTDVSTELSRQSRSQLYFREGENLRVNGRQLLVESLNTPNKALAQLTDVYGTCNAYLNQLDSAKAGVFQPQVLDTLGEQDYRAFLVGELIEDLEVTFERTGAHDNTKTDANNKLTQINNGLTLIAFGQVKKTLSVQNGQLLVGYPRE
jgi:hypothetical protein